MKKFRLEIRTRFLSSWGLWFKNSLPRKKKKSNL